MTQRAFIKLLARVDGAFNREVHVNVDHIMMIEPTDDGTSWSLALSDGEILELSATCNPFFELERVPMLRVGK